MFTNSEKTPKNWLDNVFLLLIAQVLFTWSICDTFWWIFYFFGQVIASLFRNKTNDQNVIKEALSFVTLGLTKVIWVMASVFFDSDNAHSAPKCEKKWKKIKDLFFEIIIIHRSTNFSHAIFDDDGEEIFFSKKQLIFVPLDMLLIY